MTLNLGRIQAICFDVDGTLSDTDDLWIASFEKRFNGLRRLFPHGDIRSFARWAIMCAESPGNLVYHWLDRADLDDEVCRMYSYISQRGLRRSPRNFWLIEGVHDMLARLQPHYALSVVSARDCAGTEAFLDQHGLHCFFNSVATSLTCRYTKPFPDPVLWAAAQMGVAPQNCLMVGDTTVDIRAGKAAGAQTVGVLCGFGKEDELRRAGADLILPSTSVLADLLLELQPAAAEPAAPALLN